MTQTDAIARLQRQIDRLRNLTSLDYSDPVFIKWERDTKLAIEHIFGLESRNINEFNSIMLVFQNGKEHAEAILQSMIEELQEYPMKALSTSHDESTVDGISRICQRFHVVARQLRQRHDKRPTLEIEDEYDVQDLLHALLKLEFDDVRAEEWTPSYAGKSSRMDFLLKHEQIIVETKKTRRDLGERQIGDQLIIDIARYQSHPDCKFLFCFIYDPEGHISNPAGIEKDLSIENKGMKVKVLVAPKGI